MVQWDILKRGGWGCVSGNINQEALTGSNDDVEKKRRVCEVQVTKGTYAMCTSRRAGLDGFRPGSNPVFERP